MSTIKILIVEDNWMVSDQLAAELGDQGLEIVDQVEKGEEAIELISENNNIDLIIMDIDLAGQLNGFETVKEIHEIQEIPVIYLTQMPTEENLIKSTETANYGFLPKPFDLLTLTKAIERALLYFKNEIKDEKAFTSKTSTASANQIFVKNSIGKYYKITKDEILYVKADGSCCTIVTPNKNHPFSFNLAKFKQKYHQLNLFHCHKSFLINMDKVAGFYPENSIHKVVLTIDGKHNHNKPPNTETASQEAIHSIPISKKNWDEFKRRLRNM